MLRYAQAWERDEVETVKDKLEELKLAHKTLRQTEKRLAKRGLAGDLDDAVIDFIPAAP